MSLSNVVYSPLKEEEEQLTGWSKSTIDYVMSHKTDVESSIRGISKTLNKVLNRTDLDDIYMEVLTYLYSCDDYNIGKAYDRSNSDGLVSLSGYVHSCIKFCVLRYVTTMYSTEKSLVREYVKDDEGRELSLFDTIPDSREENDFNSIGYQLDTICREYEYQRYQHGLDVFQIWFIRLQTMIKNKQDRYKDILSILGVSKKELGQLEKTSKDGIMINIAKAVSITGVEEAIKILRKYTYSADKIEKVVELF